MKRGQLSRITLQRETHDAETSGAETSTSKRGKSRTPPHISVYISFDAIVEFKRLALDLGHLSPHDLYREGLDMVLAKHGRPSLAQIEGKGTNVKRVHSTLRRFEGEATESEIHEGKR